MSCHFNRPSRYSWLNEKRAIEQVAAQWEGFFDDAPDYTFASNTTVKVHESLTVTIPAGEVIDDIRIYVDFLTPETSTTTQLEGWIDSNLTGLFGVSGVVKFRRDGEVPLIATILMNQQEFEQRRQEGGGTRFYNAQYGYRWRQTFQHELGHAFGIGPSPAWKNNIEWTDINTPWFTGSNATSAYRTMLAQNNRSAAGVTGVPLAKENIDQTPPIHWAGLPSILTWSFFDVYWIRENELVNLSLATLGAFADIGWQVRFEKGMVTMPNPNIGLWPCFFDRDEPADNYHMCPPESVPFPARFN